MFLTTARVCVLLTCADVPAGVGYDPDGGEDVDVVDGRLLCLRHVQDDEEDEDLVSSVAVQTLTESCNDSKEYRGPQLR